MPCTVLPASVIGSEQTSVPGLRRARGAGAVLDDLAAELVAEHDVAGGVHDPAVPPARRARSTNCRVYFAACRSEPQMPQASVRASTWPSAGTRIGDGIDDDVALAKDGGAHGCFPLRRLLWLRARPRQRGVR